MLIDCEKNENIQKYAGIWPFYKWDWFLLLHKCLQKHKMRLSALKSLSASLYYMKEPLQVVLPLDKPSQSFRFGWCFLKNGPFPAPFSFFVFSTQLTVNVQNKRCQWLDSNRRPLELETIALPTEPQPLPWMMFYLTVHDLPSKGR